MAAALSALNAKIRSQPVLNYLCSTHFWGPASNFGIPIAAIMDTRKDPEIISGQMTLALSLYSGTFMRYSMAVTPKNPLLFACHFLNFSAQVTQGYRYVDYWHFGGRDKSLAVKEERSGGEAVLEEGKRLVGKAGEEGREMVGQAKEKVTR